ncbi:MAG TPA: HAMP domain-containing histidine kinase, partial [Caldithrix abyssi]|nr:HAMP domain-containing histidine kinase [Caldithrix abyssi]
LAIAKKIIEEHGGKIKIHSKEKIGTTVTIIFPLNESPS